MQLIRKMIMAPDGRITRFHRIQNLDFSATDGTYSIVVGSWEIDPFNQQPIILHHIVDIVGNKTSEEIQSNLLNNVFASEIFSGGVLMEADSMEDLKWYI